MIWMNWIWKPWGTLSRIEQQARLQSEIRTGNVILRGVNYSFERRTGFGILRDFFIKIVRDFFHRKCTRFFQINSRLWLLYSVTFCDEEMMLNNYFGYCNRTREEQHNDHGKNFTYRSQPCAGYHDLSDHNGNKGMSFLSNTTLCMVPRPLWSQG